jgi:phospholipase/carboxylesterase
VLAKVEPPNHLLIALHGWGANALDLASLAPFLNLPDCQMLFPEAPFPHPYSSQGRMWYGFPTDSSLQNRYDFRDLPELIESRQRLLDWLRSLESSTGVPLSRTVLAGFSQGGAMTLDVGLQLPLAGLIVLSGYLHAPLQPSVSPLPPVLIVHGRQDTVVPVAAARQARDGLVALGAAVQYHEFDMGHEIRPNIIQIMQSFVEESLFSPDQATETK